MVALWAALILVQDSPYLEADGFLAWEVESAPVAGKWAKEKALAGHSGGGYYTWRGPDLAGPNERAALTYRFEILTPGRYQLRIHNRHDHRDSTLENDCYTRLDGGPWVKTFSSQRGQWTWSTSHEFGEGRKPPAEYTLSAGSHTLQITGRSVNFSIDRVHLYRDGAAGGTDLSRPVSTTLAQAMTGPGPYVKLAAIAAKVRSGRGLGEALAGLRQKVESADREEAEEARRLLEALEKHAQKSLEAALALRASNPLEALPLLDRAAVQFAGHEAGEKAREEAAALRRDPSFQKEAKAEALWAKVEDLKARLQPHNGALDPKSEAFRRRNEPALRAMLDACLQLQRTFPGTAAGGRAAALLEQYR